MKAEDRLEQLKEDYLRRIKNCDKILDAPDIDNETKIRVTAKRSVYQYFVVELQR